MNFFQNVHKKYIKSGWMSLWAKQWWHELRLHFFIADQIAQVVQPMHANGPGNLGNLGCFQEIWPWWGTRGGWTCKHELKNWMLEWSGLRHNQTYGWANLIKLTSSITLSISCEVITCSQLYVLLCTNSIGNLQSLSPFPLYSDQRLVT